MNFLEQIKLFFFYRRYRWTAQNFTDLQETLIGYQKSLGAAISGEGILTGFAQNGAIGLEVGFTAGLAVNSEGKLLAKNLPGTVVVSDNIKSLVVARPTLVTTNFIPNPLNPFSLVPLNQIESCEIVAINGDANDFPEKQDGDVILFGVTASAGSALIDNTLCELFTKKTELSKLNFFTKVVGNTRECTHRTLQEALDDAIIGDRIHVPSSILVDTPIVADTENISIHFAPGAEVINFGGATGLELAASGIRVQGGKFVNFLASSEIPIHISSHYCYVSESIIENGSNGIVDVNGTSNTVGVIYEV